MSAALSVAQRKAVNALVAGQNITSAAKTAGVNERTVRRWHDSPAFATELRRADDEQMIEIARILNVASKSAVVLMITAMNDRSASLSLRLRAADSLMRYRLAFYDAITLTERVARLEQALEGYHEQG